MIVFCSCQDEGSSAQIWTEAAPARAVSGLLARTSPRFTARWLNPSCSGGSTSPSLVLNCSLRTLSRWRLKPHLADKKALEEALYQRFKYGWSYGLLSQTFWPMCPLTFTASSQFSLTFCSDTNNLEKTWCSGGLSLKRDVFVQSQLHVLRVAGRIEKDENIISSISKYILWEEYALVG